MRAPATSLAVTTNHELRCSTNPVSCTCQCSQDGLRISEFPTEAHTLLSTHPRACSTHLCHLVLTPKTGIVQGHIPMLIHCIDVSFVL